MSGQLMKSILFGMIAPDISLIEMAGGKKMHAFGDTLGLHPKINTPENPAKKAMQRNQLARNAAASVLGAGRSGTMLTGQQGVSGQAMTDRPTLLGR